MLKEKQDELREFGQKMFEMRKANHMTQMQLADAIDVDYRMVSRYETGQAEPGALYYDRLLDVCGQKLQSDTVDLLQQFASLTLENRQRVIDFAFALNVTQKQA